MQLLTSHGGVWVGGRDGGRVISSLQWSSLCTCVVYTVLVLYVCTCTGGGESSVWIAMLGEGGEGESQSCQTVKTVRTKVAFKVSRLFNKVQMQ